MRFVCMMTAAMLAVFISATVAFAAKPAESGCWLSTRSTGAEQASNLVDQVNVTSADAATPAAVETAPRYASSAMSLIECPALLLSRSSTTDNIVAWTAATPINDAMVANYYNTGLASWGNPEVVPLKTHFMQADRSQDAGSINPTHSVASTFISGKDKCHNLMGCSYNT